MCWSKPFWVFGSLVTANYNCQLENINCLCWPLPVQHFSSWPEEEYSKHIVQNDVFLVRLAPMQENAKRKARHVYASPCQFSIFRARPRTHCSNIMLFVCLYFLQIWRRHMTMARLKALSFHVDSSSLGVSELTQAVDFQTFSSKLFVVFLGSSAATHTHGLADTTEFPCWPLSVEHFPSWPE